jgi:hypothetical protein
MTGQRRDFRISPELETKLKSMRTMALGAGAVGMLATIAGFFVDSNQFYHSYLWTFMFWVGLSIGCLGWLMIQYLTGGNWGVMIRRVAESSAKSLPLWLLFFIPVIIGIPVLYSHSWANAALVAKDPVLQHKQPYLNTPFWVIRGFIYLGGFALLGFLLNRLSDREDREGGSGPLKAMAKISAPGMIFLIFGITFYSTDWALSLSAHWYSTMYPLLFIAGTGLSAIAFIIVMMVTLSEEQPLKQLMTHRHLHDIGKFMLANVMLWAYFSFSQFLIIWAGNLPEEIPFYKQRQVGGWQYVALALILGHFCLPFALLLSRDLKRNFKFLRRIAIFVILIRMVDVYWLVAGEYTPGHLNISWMDFTSLIGIGGIWFFVFLGILLSRPILPMNTPDLEEALAHGRE